MCANFTRLCWVWPTKLFRNKISHWKTHWRLPFIHHVGCAWYGQILGLDNHRFCHQDANLDCKTSESESNESSTTSSTNFTSKSDASGSTESSESDPESHNVISMQSFSIFHNSSWKSHYFYTFRVNWNSTFFLPTNSANFYHFPA